MRIVVLQRDGHYFGQPGTQLKGQDSITWKARIDTEGTASFSLQKLNKGVGAGWERLEEQQPGKQQGNRADVASGRGREENDVRKEVSGRAHRILSTG